MYICWRSNLTWAQITQSLFESWWLKNPSLESLSSLHNTFLCLSHTKWNFPWGVLSVPYSYLQAQSHSRKPRANSTKQRLTWTNQLGKWSMLPAARVESWLQPPESSVMISMNSSMLALRWQAKHRWVWRWLSGTNPRLFTLMDCPSSRPIEQIRMKNLSTSCPVAFFAT